VDWRKMMIREKERESCWRVFGPTKARKSDTY